MDTYINAEGFTVFTEHFFRERGHCCGNNCLHCPYGKLSENTKNKDIIAVNTEGLPDFRIGLNAGKLSALLRKMNINSFHQAARFVCLMPYKRNRDIGNALNAVSEQRATCSGKHHILAALASENNCSDLQLVIGIYHLNGENYGGNSSEKSAKINSLLQKNDLNYIPEAHTYLRCKQQIFDFTTLFANNNQRFLDKLILEKTVSTENLFKEKIPFHQDFLQKWIIEQNIVHSLDQIWAIRENCIAAIS